MVYEKGIWIRPGGCNLAGWLRTEKRNDNGQIIQLPVIEGQKVKKGQLIAAIDPRDIALQYAATKSAYETASAQVERNKRLLSRQAISVQEYEISLANFQKAKSEYELSANNMRDTKFYRKTTGGKLSACQLR